MRRFRPVKPAAFGAALGISLLGGLVLAGGTAAQYPPIYPTTPTQPSTPAPSPTPAPSTSSGHSVTIAGATTSTYHFRPHKLVVSKGTKVKWSWTSNAPHNVTFSSLGKHSQTGATGSYALKFRKKGTFRYLCTVHGFSAKIVVK